MKRLASSAIVAWVIAAWAIVSPVHSADPLLEDTARFAGTILYATVLPPGLVLGIVRDGETAVVGFGQLGYGSTAEPDGDTLLRIGSVNKVLTGAVLASMVADGTVALTDPLERYLDWGVPMPSLGGRTIRLIDLATHSAGFPQETALETRGPADDPFSALTKDALIAQLGRPLLYPPGTGARYSNIGFTLLAQALSAAAGKPFETLLHERVLDPLGMTSTVFAPTDAQRGRLLQGHDIDGTPLPDVPTGPIDLGSGGLYSTTNDMLRWLAWHLDRFAPEDAEMRLIDHAAWLPRDGLSPVSGLDESGTADAIGLGWIVMQPEGDRPLILQKSGLQQGVMSYAAFAPTRGIGVFVAMSEYRFASFPLMVGTANQIIGELAPR